MDHHFTLVGVNFFRVECPLGPFDCDSESANDPECNPQAIERGKLVLLDGGQDMTDAGWASQEINNHEDKKRS